VQTPPPLRHVFVAPPEEDESAWTDLDTMSVNLRDKRVRMLDRAILEYSEPRLEITHTAHATTVRDIDQPGAKMTFHESVRWVGGYLWSSGDLILSSDKRLVRIEFTSTDPKYVGSTIWEKPPLAGSRTAALLLGAGDRSPNEVAKHIAFAGYEPSGDAPIEVAVIEALARESFRSTLTTRRSCSKREVRMLMWRPRDLAVIVACPEGADIEHVSF
jgi:hypothetical protein